MLYLQCPGEKWSFWSYASTDYKFVNFNKMFNLLN